MALWLPAATAVQASGASLKILPTTGTYQVNGLVDVSFLLDTGGDSVNAVNADILFPPDKLQVVNPAASTSFISIWVTAPTYSNTAGTISFQGGLPSPGIKTSAGVVSTVTFRVKSAGQAAIKFAPTSKVLRNDGAGTNILTSSETAQFDLKPAPPAGPVVSSPTHGDSNQWYNNPAIQFSWEAVANAVGYSYSFDQNLKGLPADEINATTTAVQVKATGDGVWYFHIKSKTDTWGGVTTFPVQIDVTAPAGFQPKLDKTTATTDETNSLRFLTTDAASGIDHYEVKEITKSGQTSSANTLFVESSSPFIIPKQPAGTYEYIVRVFDRAGNTTDASAVLTVIAGGLPFYARTPFLTNPAVANAALIALASVVMILIILITWRRLRIRSTFRHDLNALERDAYKKYADLQRELAELHEAQQLVDYDLHQAPAAAPPASVASVPPQPPVASPSPTPVSTPPPALPVPPHDDLPPAPPIVHPIPPPATLPKP